MDNKKIGSFIAERRKELGLTQQQLADLLSVSNKAISKWETGEGYPEVSIIPQLCKNLSISTDDFFAGENNSPRTNGSKMKAFSLKAMGTGCRKRAEFVNQKTKAIRPFILCAIAMYYILPMLFLFNRGFVVVQTLFLIPIACIICGFIYGTKYCFSIRFAIGASILFLPAMLYIHQTDHIKVTLLLSLSYGVITLFANAVGYIKKHFVFSVVKKEKLDLGKLQ